MKLVGISHPHNIQILMFFPEAKLHGKIIWHVINKHNTVMCDGEVNTNNNLKNLQLDPLLETMIYCTKYEQQSCDSFNWNMDKIAKCKSNLIYFIC